MNTISDYLKSNFTKLVLSIILICLIAPVLSYSQDTGEAVDDEVLLNRAIQRIYNTVSSTDGSVPDWDYVKSLFNSKAVIVLRTSRDVSTVMTLEEFIADFVRFYGTLNLEEQVFVESVKSVKLQIFGNVASAYVVYSASVMPSDRPEMLGLDIWSFVKEGGSWKAVSVVNDIELAAGPIGAEWKPEPVEVKEQ